MTIRDIYYVDVEGENRTHEVIVYAAYTKGYFFLHPRNEREYLDPGVPNTVDICKVYLSFKGKRREIKKVPSWLEIAIVEDIIKQEDGNEIQRF